jgi:hypothetical protein
VSGAAPKAKPTVDVAAAMTALLRGTKAERSWDKVLGGAESRAYRDVAAWAVERLVANGAALEDVIEYLRGTAELG